jgi:hypothetical protein
MTMLNNQVTLPLREQISSNLAFRHSVDDLFDYINSLSETRIVVDFSGIESISRSFAHQYIINKEKSDKIIVECNTPLNIKPMFDLVERQRSRKSLAPSFDPTLT